MEIITTIVIWAFEEPLFNFSLAGIGAILMGLGSFFTGFAAYKTATKGKEPDESKTRDITDR